jgi:hypothetical protein
VGEHASALSRATARTKVNRPLPERQFYCVFGSCCVRCFEVNYDRARELRRRFAPFRRRGHVEHHGKASAPGRYDPRSELMRKLRAPSTIRFGASIAAASKRSHKKFRKLSRARPGAASTSLMRNWRRRRRRALAGANGLPGRGGKLRGPYHIRALRARWRVAPASRARLRSTAKRSSAAAKNATASGLELIDLTLQRVRQLKQEFGGPISRDSPPKSPTVIGTVVEIISSPSCPIQQNKKPLIEQAPATPPLTRAPRDGGRSLIGSTNLELAITEAVKKEGPGCEAFVGVIVQQTRPKSRFDANWAVRGVKFGRADRDKANEAITAIVERMQQEFRLFDDS